MSMPRVVVFGEALTDIVQKEPGNWRGYPGGAPWNVARTLSKLGIATAFAGAVSNDSLGDEIALQSEDAGLDLRYLQRVNADPLVAIVASCNPPHYFFAGEADLHFDVNLLPQDWLEACELCHFSCISLARQPLSISLLKAAELAHNAGKMISYDPNWRNLMTDDYRTHVFPKMVSLANVIKLSDEDLKHLYPGATEAEAVREIRTINESADILLTKGEHGLTLYMPEETYQQQSIKVTVADTVGAGDACMAGWIGAGLLGITAVTKRLRFAASCASVSCQHAGAYAPTFMEVEKLSISA